MTVAVTVNAPGRFRGFLASCMCEIAPGVYTAPRMTAAVRERVWAVLEEWWVEKSEVTVLMTWEDRSLPGGQQVRTLGTPPRELRDHHGVFLAKRSLSESDREVLEKLATFSGLGSLTTESGIEDSPSGNPDGEPA